MARSIGRVPGWTRVLRQPKLQHSAPPPPQKSETLKHTFSRSAPRAWFCLVSPSGLPRIKLRYVQHALRKRLLLDLEDFSLMYWRPNDFEHGRLLTGPEQCLVDGGGGHPTHRAERGAIPEAGPGHHPSPRLP